LSKEAVYRLIQQPELQNASLLVGWKDDAAMLGMRVTEYIVKKMEYTLFCEIEPEEFFPFGGVIVENNIASFPESKFYFKEDTNLVIMTSSGPVKEWHKFLTTVLDIAQTVCSVHEIITVGGMVSLLLHTIPRPMIASANTPEMREILSAAHLTKDIDYESPPGQRPSINNYLAWLAKQRNIPAASLWTMVPFYLVPTTDPRSYKTVLQFLDEKYRLGLDMSEMDEEIRKHDEIMEKTLTQFPDIRELLRKLEGGISLSDEEHSRLVDIIQEHLVEEKWEY
jgi:proteasome assembly chaperone (PAC2) family protein